MPGIYNAAQLKKVLGRATTHRLDLVGIYNSEGLQLGHGWDTAIQENLSSTYGVYGTAAYSFLEQKGGGAGVGYWDGNPGSKTINYLANVNLTPIFGGQVTAAPAYALQHMDWSAAPTADVNPTWPMYLASGTNTQPAGIQINESSVIPVNEALTFTHWGVNMDLEAGGQFEPIIRRGSAPNTVLYTYPVQNYTGTPGTIRKVSYNLAAATRNHSVEFRTHQGWNPATMSGPLFLTYMRAMRTNKTNGIALSPFYSHGARSAYDMYMCLNAFPATSWQHFFDVLCEYQHVQKSQHHAIFDIYEGSNQLGETSVAAGAPVQGTPAHADNYLWYIQQLVSIVETQWVNSGRQLSNIAFRVACTHPQRPDVGEGNLPSYRTALKTGLRFNNQEKRVCLVDYSEMFTAAQMNTAGYFLDGVHLTRSGYIALDAAAWGYVASAPTARPYLSSVMSPDIMATWIDTCRCRH